MNMYQVHLLPRNPSVTQGSGKGAETIQYQRPGFLLRDVTGVAGREANFQAVGDIGKFIKIHVSRS